MSGAPHAAHKAALTFMTGGNRSDIVRLTPLFDAMGREIYHLGKTGAGMTAKVLNNFVAACSVVSVRHALAQAENLGFDPETLRDVMDKSSGQTWFGSKYDTISWARELHDTANTIGILEKDVNAFISATQENHSPFYDEVITALQCLPPAPS